MSNPALMLPGESFTEWHDRAWHAGILSRAAYGHHCVIARIRRGKYVRIPPQWRGKTVDRQTVNKRQSKEHHRNRRRKGQHAL